MAAVTSSRSTSSSSYSLSEIWRTKGALTLLGKEKCYESDVPTTKTGNVYATVKHMLLCFIFLFNYMEVPLTG